MFDTKHVESGATCTGTMTFTISQTDQTFVGVQRGPGAISCTGLALALIRPNSSDSTEFDNERIGTGLADQTDIVFTLNTLNGTNNGTVNAKNGTMSGTSIWRIPVLPRGTVPMSGTFTGVRQ